MGTYKVIQDIEAEDKLLGPLTLKQFIFAGIALTCLYLSVMAATRNAAWMLAILVPPMLFTGFMAWPWGRDQPTEIWLLGKLRFFFKPRRRIWDQSGVKELVTITVPKKDEHIYTNNLTETEVKSRLQALANTIDSRGWAVKNVDVNLFAQPSYNTSSSDRLIDLSNIPREVSSTDVTAADDILDEANNPTAQHLDQMITSSSQAHHQALMSQMQQGTQGNAQASSSPNDYWFMNQPSSAQVPAGYATFDGSSTVAPGSSQPSAGKASTPDEQALVEKLRKQASQPGQAQSHLKIIQPAGDQPTQSAPPASSDPAILNLAHNDDLNVATIAREANKSTHPPDDEVVVSLR